MSLHQIGLVENSRRQIADILAGRDPRLLAVVGPCSIHDVNAGIEYGQRLAALARELDDRVVVVMRAYFEKPRTNVGWPGLILDPDLDGSGDVARGLWLARRFLGAMLDLGLPTATEFLDPVSPQYIAELVCWAAIGARTSESQMHRQVASGLSMPLGFKNGTDGSVDGAINAIKTAAMAHTYLGISGDGCVAALRSLGNPNCHVVLRGGTNGPNYAAGHVESAESKLVEAGLPAKIVVDCSHDNSRHRPKRQPEVLASVMHQIVEGSRSIVGVMIESNLFGGNQTMSGRAGKLRYGVSITDGCLDWPNTEMILRNAHAALAPRFGLQSDWSSVRRTERVEEGVPAASA